MGDFFFVIITEAISFHHLLLLLFLLVITTAFGLGNAGCRAHILAMYNTTIIMGSKIDSSKIFKASNASRTLSKNLAFPHLAIHSLLLSSSPRSALPSPPPSCVAVYLVLKMSEAAWKAGTLSQLKILPLFGMTSFKTAALMSSGESISISTSESPPSLRFADPDLLPVPRGFFVPFSSPSCPCRIHLSLFSSSLHQFLEALQLSDHSPSELQVLLDGATSVLAGEVDDEIGMWRVW
ncbi:hypothetical protein F5876DRAFT_78928 [Lentinula aff. lateritia]|uniref:Uncharacterized protein n=1 Tax=Lentinula aff. lateritia TaxID=2804960 RepID=A0ACC1TU14_9AGAR|nr:hypothetical protein F5876DRAFT_78928 [Lentinula aff. lateritia]